MIEKFAERLKELDAKQKVKDTEKENVVVLTDELTSQTFYSLVKGLEIDIRKINDLSNDLQLSIRKNEHARWEIEHKYTFDLLTFYVNYPSESVTQLRVEYEECQNPGNRLAFTKSARSLAVVMSNNSVRFMLDQENLFDVDETVDFLLSWFLDLKEKRLDK